MYKNAPRKNPWRRGRRDARRYRDTHRLQEEQDGAYITLSLIPHPALLSMPHRKAMCRDGGYIHPHFAYLLHLRHSPLRRRNTGGAGTAWIYSASARLLPHLSCFSVSTGEKGWHNARDDDPHGTHTATHTCTSSQTPRSRATSRQGRTDRRSTKKKTKENKMMPPWKGLLPETTAHFSCLCWRCWQSQCMGLKQGSESSTRKERRRKGNGEMRLSRGRYTDNEQSATKATPRVLHKQLASRRGKSTGATGEVEDEITDAKQAKKDEEEQARL
ncbi:hypothetical protein B0H14DRAFT_2618268 [Mycena olivaceomarginata]|nr:hypothetical protein B0H14DRAFT_2618268 [Mycena olivaceomarginata]